MSAAYTTEALTVVIERMERVIRSHGPMGFDELRASICRPADMVHAALLLAGERGRLMRAGSGRICIPVPVEPRRAPAQAADAAEPPAPASPRPGTVASRVLELLSGSDAPLSAPAVAAALGISEGHAANELFQLRARGKVIGERIGGRTRYAVPGTGAAEKMVAGIPRITRAQANALTRLSAAGAPMTAREATASSHYSVDVVLGLEARGLVQPAKVSRRCRVYRITDAGRAALATLGAMA